jgi:hypothetical protein
LRRRLGGQGTILGYSGWRGGMPRHHRISDDRRKDTTVKIALEFESGIIQNVRFNPNPSVLEEITQAYIETPTDPGDDIKLYILDTETQDYEIVYYDAHDVADIAADAGVSSDVAWGMLQDFKQDKITESIKTA